MRSLLLLLLLFSPLFSQTVEYLLTFDNAVHHEAEVTVTWTNIRQPVLEARMSRSSPGRYALHEFAKNVYNVRVTDGKKRPLEFTRPDPSQWNIAGHDGTVIVTYTIFGDRVDGTYLGIDRTHAHLNAPATYLWARGFHDRPVKITFRVPLDSKWKIATQLFPTSDPSVFTAPNFQYLMDSPAELSDHRTARWNVATGGKEQTFSVVLHGPDSSVYLEKFAEMTRSVVSETEAMWGSHPLFDNGHYLFLCDFHPFASGDGMEHRNSTVITSTATLEKSAVRLLNTMVHEYFHTWNVERIRPASLEPFNFEAANISAELWLAEGFTNYYTPVLVHRAQISSVEDYAAAISGNLNFVLNAPGSKYFSAADMSRYAPFADAATSVDVTNTSNTYISYYSFGETIGLGLDLTIRTRFPGRSLDDVMRTLKERHGVPEKPYTMEDVRAAVGTVVNDHTFAENFFSRYITGKEFVPYVSLLAAAGFEMRKAAAGKVWLGNLPLRFEGGEAILSGGTAVGSPAYVAGLDRGDKILLLDGKKIGAAGDIDSILSKRKPGEVIVVECLQRGEVRKLSVTLAENPKWEVVTFEKAGKAVTPAIAEFRESWLGKKSKEVFPSLVKHCPECTRTYEFRNKFCPLDGKELKIVR